MKVAIMQPYFFPYVGYFQLIAAVDMFIVYDNIKYTKKGWINRNRMLINGKDEVFSLPLQSDSDSLDVCERTLAADFNRAKLLNKIAGAYRGAPNFDPTFSLVEQIVQHKEANLFQFLYHSLVKTCAHLSIKTAIKVSSEIAIDHSLTNQEKVLALCQAAGASTYVNAIGGKDLYSAATFNARGFDLQFICPQPIEYKQFDHPFVSWLSIIDVMMFNSSDVVGQRHMRNYEFVTNQAS
jgi:WbqC-like protein family